MRWLQFILSHSIFIALCAAALSFQTVILLKLQAGIYLYGFVFFATLCTYNFYWLLSKYGFSYNSPSVNGFFSKESLQISLMILSGAGMAFCFFNSTLKLLIVFPAAIGTVLYSVPLLPFGFLKFTKKAGVLKTMLLALSWTYVTVIIPINQTSILLSSADFFIISGRFLFMLMLCIIFDNRDVAVDKIRGLRSLATDLHPKMMGWLIVLIFSILLVTNFFAYQFGLNLSQSVALQVSTIALLVAYYYSTKKQGYFFYYFFIDGLMIFSALATFIASI